MTHLALSAMSSVTSLKASWQQQRQQRQQTLTQRQHQVRTKLDCFYQTRQDNAIALRQTLQQFQAQLHQDTQNFLFRVSTQRQEQAIQLSQKLCHFTQVLRQQTAELLSMQTADRGLMAQQLFQELDEFHSNLIASTAMLRKDLQQQIRLLRAETQDMRTATQVKLQAHRQARIQKQMKMMQELSNYVEVLHFEMQVYLTELAKTRQVRSQKIRQELQVCHDRRLAETEALFQQFAKFRAELRTVYAELRRSVWGEISSEAYVKPDSRKIVTPQPIAVAQPKSPVRMTSPTTSSTTSPAIQSANTSVFNPVTPAKLATPMSVATGTTTGTATGTTTRTVTGTIPETVKSPLLAPAQPPAIAGLSALEQQIYYYIEQTQGAHLTEIETALGLSRFQTVDVLRSLIKKSLVVQRNRLYLLQSDRLQSNR